jgi:hypothetical protein
VSDAAALAAGFDAALRAHGVAAGTRRARTFADVLVRLPPASVAALYWRARAAMLPSIDDLASFHAAFATFFGRADEGAPFALLAQPAPAAPPQERPPVEILPPPPSERPAGAADAARAPIQWIPASSEETLRELCFEDMTDLERTAMLRLIARLRIAAEVRPSRRRRSQARGDRFDFRGTLRGAARTAGELIRRRATARRTHVRPLVFLIDVSGSMAPFARALLQYARATAGARPRVRAFAFATRLTDLSSLLRRATDERLMRALGEAVSDYGGGTRIGAALRSFNERYAQRGAARGGTVVIVSDGWERDDPALVGNEMRRLRRLARRIVWVNPHKRHSAYAPLAGGMAAALPHLDAFVSGHNLRTLDALAGAIEGRT